MSIYIQTFKKRLSNGLHVIIFPLALAMSEDNNISFWYTNTFTQQSRLLTLAYKVKCFSASQNTVKNTAFKQFFKTVQLLLLLLFF